MGKCSLPAHIRAVANKPTHKPSLPRLRCLDDNVDADDEAAGAVVADTWSELMGALDENYWQDRHERLEEEEPRRRRAKPIEPPAPPPAELYIPTAPSEAPSINTVEPVVSPRIRSEPATRRKIPKTARLVTIDIADPDAVAAAVERVEPPRGATINGHGPGEWQAPARRTVRVVARADTLAVMHARGQLDDASFYAGRAFQKLYEQAELTGMPSVDITMPRIVVRAIGGDYVGVDARRRAAEKLHQVEGELVARYGLVGLRLIRDVLGRGLTIEAAAGARGDENDKQGIRFWGSFLRRCLKALAVILGFATAGTPPSPRPRGGHSEAGQRRAL
jgi:hypothetical protein